jgi:hypothetical protein
MLEAPLWSNDQSSWLKTQRSWVRLPALPDFLCSIESGTGSTQPRENKSTKVGTKIRRPVEIAQSVYLACGLKATEIFVVVVSVGLEWNQVHYYRGQLLAYYIRVGL